MTENPFASPNLTAEELDAADHPRNLRGPLKMLLWGPLLGSLIIGLVGCVTAGVIALFEGDIEGVVICGFFGMIFGAIGGAPIGLLMGGIAGATRPRFRKRLRVLTAIPTTLLAIGCSFLEGSILSLGRMRGFQYEIIFGATLLVGGAGGAIAGLLLGKVLGNLAWGPAEETGATGSSLENPGKTA